MAKSDLLKSATPLIIGGAVVFLGARFLNQRFGGADPTPEQEFRRAEASTRSREAISEGLGGLGSAFGGLGSGIGTAGAGLGSGIGSIGITAGDVVDDLTSPLDPFAEFFGGVQGSIRDFFQGRREFNEAAQQATLDENLAIAESKARGRLRRAELFEQLKSRATEFATTADLRLESFVGGLRSRGREAIRDIGGAVQTFRRSFEVQREATRARGREATQAVINRAIELRNTARTRVSNVFNRIRGLFNR